jgi:hypothetical protein
MDNNDNIININNNTNNLILQRQKKTFDYINKLPFVLINYIGEYIPFTSLVFVNKNYYIKYHYLLKICLIPKLCIENYIRDIVKRDYHFVFDRLLNENYKKWLNMNGIIYKNTIYKNYIYFLKDFCLIHESNKCRNILNNFLQENGLCKNQHKKNTSKHIEWKN